MAKHTFYCNFCGLQYDTKTKKKRYCKNCTVENIKDRKDYFKEYHEKRQKEPEYRERKRRQAYDYIFGKGSYDKKLERK